MTSSQIIRWSGPFAILAGLLTIVAVLFFQEEAGPSLEPTDPVRWVYWAVAMATFLAVMGVYAFQAEESGIWGLAGFLLATVGSALFLAEDVAELAGSIMALGIVLLGVGSWMAGKLPRWVPGLWFAAVLIGIPGLFLEDLMHTLNVIGGIAFGLGFIGAGYTLWTQRSAPAPRPT